MLRDRKRNAMDPPSVIGKRRYFHGRPRSGNAGGQAVGIDVEDGVVIV
jgi:hypothetical protein